MGGMRIIGGRYRGKRLATPPDRSVRPTSERTREALFNILDHAGMVQDARFLDLFCGTGAVGLEAWSRGARDVWLIDQNTAFADTNAETLGQPAALHVRRMDATRLVHAPCRFDVVFLDPPYRSGLAGPTLHALHQGWLAEDAQVIVELAAKEELVLPPGFTSQQDRRYGAARLVFLQPNSIGDAAADPVVADPSSDPENML